MHLRPILFASIIAVLVSSCARGSPIVIDFENFTDGDLITNQIPGLKFTNTQVATAGISLNEIDFPPHSGKNVVFDSGGPITIRFDTPVTSFGAYFTYVTSVTLSATGPGSPSPVEVFSMFSNNTGTNGNSGSSPNEFLQVARPAGISILSITGDPTGGSFAMDDVTLPSAPGSSMPEPPSVLLWSVGLSAVYLCRRAVRT